MSRNVRPSRQSTLVDTFFCFRHTEEASTCTWNWPCRARTDDQSSSQQPSPFDIQLRWLASGKYALGTTARRVTESFIEDGSIYNPRTRPTYETKRRILIRELSKQDKDQGKRHHVTSTRKPICQNILLELPISRFLNDRGRWTFNSPREDLAWRQNERYHWQRQIWNHPVGRVRHRYVPKKHT